MEKVFTVILPCLTISRPSSHTASPVRRGRIKTIITSENPRHPALQIAKAENDLLFTTDGKQLIDFVSGFGAVLMGHSHPAILAAMREQLDRPWSTGRFGSPVMDAAFEQLAAVLPSQHRAVKLYSGGMEAAEFAIRVALEITGRRRLLGFEQSMHGKSLATASLGWNNRHGLLPDFRRLAFVPALPERQVLDNLEAELSTGMIAGVFVEPILGSSAGHSASPAFYEAVLTMCRRHGTLSIFDEILTGFRAWPSLWHGTGDETPDVLIFGKAIGNGFPVSGVALRKDYPVTPAMLPGSTYSNNSLGCAAVAATLRVIGEFDLGARLARLENTITGYLAPLREAGFQVRGRGALWVLESPPEASVDRLVDDMLQGGLAVSASNNYIKLLPAATITPEHLQAACTVIRESCLRMLVT